jgi:hypothetical protein
MATRPSPAVREFGRALTQPCGAPAGTVETFIEVPFTLGDKQLFPDGLVQIRRGSGNGPLWSRSRPAATHCRPNSLSYIWTSPERRGSTP